MTFTHTGFVADLSQERSKEAKEEAEHPRAAREPRESRESREHDEKAHSKDATGQELNDG